MILEAIEKIKKAEEKAQLVEELALKNEEKSVHDARIEAEKIISLAKSQGEEYVKNAISDAKQTSEKELRVNAEKINEELKKTEDRVCLQMELIIKGIYEKLLSD